MDQPVSHKILEYTAIFEPAEEGGYVVSVPALLGCVTEGDTFEEASSMIKDAVEGYIKVLKDDGKEIPQEKAGVVISKVAVPSFRFLSANT